jgi:hypothetical protein
MRIQVLPEDIKWGRKANSQLCPVARAIQREVAGGTLVGVGGRRVNLWTCPVSLTDSTVPDKRIELPPVVQVIIAHYDLTGEMDPFGFEL